MFRGTLRYNIDPQRKASDSEILELLSKAGLTELLLKLKESSDDVLSQATENSVLSDASTARTAEEKLLKFDIFQNGSNLSSGEKALICICRAILKKNKIVLLDEATASIDIVTEQKIQELISSEFQRCTMITIAHRLQTVMSSDRVFVMGEKRVLEEGRPADLLRDPNSKFQYYVKKMQDSEEDTRQGATGADASDDKQKFC